MKQLLTLTLLLFATTVATSQGWQQLGQPSSENANFISMSLDDDDGLYMVYQEQGTAAIIVRNFDGTDWQQVGSSPGSGINSPFALNIDTDPSGTPYVAFADASNSQRATVMKFNGTDWELVGDGAVSSGPAQTLRFAIDPSGVPYVSYGDISNDGKATVLKFDGDEWVNVGDAGISTMAAIVTCLNFDSSGTPYVAYAELSDTVTISIMKYNGTEWEYVGEPGFMEDTRVPISLVFNASGTPYLGCTDMDGVPSMLSFDGTSWQDVIVEGLSVSLSDSNSLAFDPSGTLYTAVVDGSLDSKILVKKFNGEAWQNVGGPSVSEGSSENASLIIDSEGNLYASYQDNSGHAIVKTFCPECEQPKTQLEPEYCGVTLTAITDELSATPVGSATKYQFRATDGTNTYTVIRTDNIFRMSMLPSYTYNTTYTIDVAVYIDDTWGIFGDACTVTTPALPTTQLTSEDCNSNIPSFGTNLHATPVTLATGYRFRITNGADVQTIDRPGNFFRMNQLASYEYGTTYTVDVAVLIDGDYGDYGSTCTVTTPEIPVTWLNAASCGTTVSPRFSTNLYATPVVLAEGYRFRITDLNDMSVQTTEGTASYFRLGQLATYHYNGMYMVDVAVKIDGDYGDYGPTCLVFTPAPPLTQLRAQDCGTTVTSFGMNLYADDVVLAQGYRFRVTNGASVNVIDRPNRNFRIKMLPAYSYNTAYTIEVAVMADGIWGDYGPACVVSTPGSGMRQNIANEEEAIRNITAFPNPFETSFSFALETESDEPVSLQAYDITGKMLENRTISPDEFTSLRIGENYASGIYSVIVTQGSYTNAVKIVKK